MLITSSSRLVCSGRGEMGLGEMRCHTTETDSVSLMLF